MRVSTRVAVVVGVFALIGSVLSAQAPEPLATADAGKFMGAWLLTLDSPQGPFSMTLTLADKEGKVAGELTSDIMPAQDKSPGLSPVWANRLMWLGSVGGLVMGLFLSHFLLHNPFLEGGIGTTDPSVTMCTSPFLILFFLGCLLA